MAGPIPDSYWVIENRLLAGEYPGAFDPDEAREKLGRFLDHGVRDGRDPEAHQDVVKAPRPRALAAAWQDRQ